MGDDYRDMGGDYRADDYRAMVSRGTGPAGIERLRRDELPDGDVTVEVAYSSLNYKDGLAVTGRGRIARSFPMVCGIDLAGTVLASESPDWVPGDEVVVTGYGLSETHPGGYAELQRVRGEWLVRRPASLTLAQTMAVGTAGLTAMLCVMALQDAGLDPAGGGEVLVTGASGGVGSVGVALLSRLGWRVTASTGKHDQHPYLTGLGAAECVDREALAQPQDRPLGTERWAGVLDTVGSVTLANALRQTRYGGAVAACGLAAGPDLPATVLPFILRGVRLQGVDSVQCPMATRRRAWDRLAADLPVEVLDAMTTLHPMGDLPELAAAILGGDIRGRVVVDVRA